MLAELSEIQENYRGILIGLRTKEDRSFSEAITASVGMDDEALISVACIFFEMRGDIPGIDTQEENDILLAQEFIDHLDTLGKVIVAK